MGLPLYDPAGKYGFKDKQQLINVLSVIMNETPVAVLLEEQITKKDLAILKTFFAHQDTKLKEVLGWEKGYYDSDSIASGTNTTPAAATAPVQASAPVAVPAMTPPKARLRS